MGLCGILPDEMLCMSLEDARINLHFEEIMLDSIVGFNMKVYVIFTVLIARCTRSHDGGCLKFRLGIPTTD